MVSRSASARRAQRSIGPPMSRRIMDLPTNTDCDGTKSFTNQESLKPSPTRTENKLERQQFAPQANQRRCVSPPTELNWRRRVRTYVTSLLKQTIPQATSAHLAIAWYISRS